MAQGASWGFMAEKLNQHFPFTFKGAGDDRVVYAKLKELTTPASRPDRRAKEYFPAARIAGRLAKARRPGFHPPPRRHGPGQAAEAARMAPAVGSTATSPRSSSGGDTSSCEEERGNSAVTDSRRVASCSKAICATVLAIASEQSQQGRTPRRMTLRRSGVRLHPLGAAAERPAEGEDHRQAAPQPHLGHLPGGDRRAERRHVGIHPGPQRRRADREAGVRSRDRLRLLHARVRPTRRWSARRSPASPTTSSPSRRCSGRWGSSIGGSRYYEGGPKYGRHPSHGLGMPARDLARIAYCMAHGGRWDGRQVIPGWFVAETAAPTHDVQGPEMRFKVNAQIFSHGWELPARLTGEGGRSGRGIPADARSKPGSGGQLIAFVPSLDLVVTRQTGSSGEWPYEEFLRRPARPSSTLIEQTPYTKELITDESSLHDSDRRPRPDRCAFAGERRGGAASELSTEPSDQQAEQRTVLGIQGSRFTINGKPTFLLGISYYAGLGASEDFPRRSRPPPRLGFNWLRVWATVGFRSRHLRGRCRGSPARTATGPAQGAGGRLRSSGAGRGRNPDARRKRGGAPNLAAHHARSRPWRPP